MARVRKRRPVDERRVREGKTVRGEAVRRMLDELLRSEGRAGPARFRALREMLERRGITVHAGLAWHFSAPFAVRSAREGGRGTENADLSAGNGRCTAALRC